MLGLFKLQEKKSLCTNPVYYKTSRAGHKEVGVRGHPWAGEWVPGGARGEKGKGAPKQKGTDCPNGGGCKRHVRRGELGRQGRSVLSPPGHSVGGGTVPPPAHPWHLENQ